MYILGREISPLNTRSALRLRAVRVYNIPERQPSASMKSTEVVFHDQEGTFLHCYIPKENVEKFKNCKDKDHSSKLELELTEDDLWGDEDFELENEAESPLQVIGTPLSTNLNDNAAVKRSLIDEFSSTQCSKKTKEYVVKVENLNDL
nr:replication protein A 70 kDa DNA-binding subunit D-like [Ipomoea trifida]